MKPHDQEFLICVSRLTSVQKTGIRDICLALEVLGESTSDPTVLFNCSQWVGFLKEVVSFYIDLFLSITDELIACYINSPRKEMFFVTDYFSILSELCWFFDYCSGNTPSFPTHVRVFQNDIFNVNNRMQSFLHDMYRILREVSVFYGGSS